MLVRQRSQCLPTRATKRPNRAGSWDSAIRRGKGDHPDDRRRAQDCTTDCRTWLYEIYPGGLGRLLGRRARPGDQTDPLIRRARMRSAVVPSGESVGYGGRQACISHHAARRLLAVAQWAMHLPSTTIAPSINSYTMRLQSTHDRRGLRCSPSSSSSPTELAQPLGVGGRTLLWTAAVLIPQRYV